MFERFTQSARHTVLAAQEVGLQSGAQQIHTLHLLAAILDAQDLRASLSKAGLGVEDLASVIHSEVRSSGLDEEALSAIGIDLGEVTRRAEELFGEGALSASPSCKRHIPFAPESKKALELALREAIRLHSKHISSVHLLLGVLRADCAGRRALTGRVNLATLRQRLDDMTRAAS